MSLTFVRGNGKTGHKSYHQNLSVLIKVVSEKWELPLATRYQHNGKTPPWGSDLTEVRSFTAVLELDLDLCSIWVLFSENMGENFVIESGLWFWSSGAGGGGGGA